MGSIGKPAIPALIRALKEEEYVDVRVFDAMALGYLGKGDKAAKAALREAPKDKATFVRQAATNALKNLDLEAAAQAVVF
jgi:HEAT repeat protein